MATYISASDGSLQPAFLTVMGILLLLSITSVALRLYCRVFLVHKVGADDYLIMSGLMVTIGMAVMNVFHISYGTGRHIADLPLMKILIPTLKYWYVYQLVYPVAIGLVKFSILAQYYRIFAVKRFQGMVIGVGVFVMVYTIVVIFVNAFECHTKPWRAWSPSFPKGCNNLPAAYFSTAGINILTDVTILIMPLPQLMKLNLHKRRKWALIAIFFTGAFATAASIVRLNALYKYTVTTDVSYDAIYILLWSQIEVNVAIISASAPSLRPMFSNIFKGTSYGRSYGQYRSGSRPFYGGGYGRDRSASRPRITTNIRGGIEMTSRDEENMPPGIVSAQTPRADSNSSQDYILRPNDRAMKTVMVEMRSEHGDD